MEGDRLYNYERWLHMGGFKCILHFILKNVYNLSFRRKTMLNKMRPSERLDAPLLEDELIPALLSEIKSEHEEEIIDQRLVYR